MSQTARWLRQWLREEAVLLLVSLAIVLALWGFVEIAEDIGEHETLSFDEALTLRLRQPGDPTRPIGPAWLVEAARDVTALGSTFVLLLVILIVLGYLALHGRWSELWLVTIAAVGGAVASTALKEFFGRPRPALAISPLLRVTSPSFPSGHAMLAAVVYLTLGALLARFATRRRVKTYSLAVAMLLTFLVGISRVYLGVHYPTDVLGGWSAGLAWALGCWLIARHLQRRGAIKAR